MSERVFGGWIDGWMDRRLGGWMTSWYGTIILTLLQCLCIDILHVLYIQKQSPRRTKAMINFRVSLKKT